MRPPMWLWICVLAVGLGVLVADIRAEWQQAELDELTALRARVTAAERRMADGCFLSRSPAVIAEVRR